MKKPNVIRKPNKTVVIYYNEKPYAKVDINRKSPVKKRKLGYGVSLEKFGFGVVSFLFFIVIFGFMVDELEKFITPVEAQVIEQPIVIEKKLDLIPPILKKIASCESGGTHTDKNGKVIRGKVDKADIGKYQISLTYHKKQAEKMGLDLFKESDNEKYALWLFNNQGSVPWKASSSCWIKK